MSKSEESLNPYVLSRLRADSHHVIARSEAESLLVHQGLKGRFRELLIDNLLAPWLPPYVGCGTGLIIDCFNHSRQSTQDDIVLFDKSLSPPMMGSNSAPEGLFLYESVLARIEIKSKVRRKDIEEFITSSREMTAFQFGVGPAFSMPEGGMFGAFNLFFAYSSDLAPNENNEEYNRLLREFQAQEINPLSGIVSAICVADAGFWKVGANPATGLPIWQTLKYDRALQPMDPLVWFLGFISNSCFRQHAIRQGRNPDKCLDSGIGNYLGHPFLNLA